MRVRDVLGSWLTIATLASGRPAAASPPPAAKRAQAVDAAALASAAPEPLAPRAAARNAAPASAPAPAKAAPAKSAPAKVAPAKAAPAKAVPAPLTGKARAEALREALKQLSGSDAAALGIALDTLALLGGEQASSAIATRLRRGLPPALIERAIAALVQVGRPSAGPALLELTLHRRAEIRQRAVSALGALGIRSAQSSLLYALDDPSPEVRSAAIQALARVGNARALPAVLAAADRGVAHAFETVGAIAGSRDLDTLLSRASGGDLTPIEPALRGMLERKNVSLSTKLQIVKRVEKVGSSNARMCLVQWLDAWKDKGPTQLRKALFDGIKRLDDAAKLVIKRPAGAGGTSTRAASATPAARVAPAHKAPATTTATTTSAAKPAGKTPTAAAGGVTPAASKATAAGTAGVAGDKP